MHRLILILMIAATQAMADDRPDIVLIMADDLGFSDIGCYGGEIETPTLDRLAEGGIRFRQFYNGARCCPTRASLLTGVYAHVAGIGCMLDDWGEPGYQGDLSLTCPTIAEVLEPAGYATYMAGKWHVASDIHVREREDKWNWPIQRGFTRFYGTIAGGGSYFSPATLTQHNRGVKNRETAEPGFYYTDAISDAASGFILDHAERTPDLPFFLYVSYTAPHWPLHALPEDIARYEGRYDAGWDDLRRTRFERQRDIGLATDAWSLSARTEGVPAWKDVGKGELPDDIAGVEGATKDNLKALSARRMAIYAAMVDRMDQGIGRIVEALERTGRLDNTVLIFLADNGACAETGVFGLNWAESPTMAGEGGPDSFVSYGAGWAGASNTPLRYFKHHMHEGGIATPLIVHWPDGIQEQGQWRDQVGHVIDFMPTFMELAGASRPDEFGGSPTPALPGVSLLPAFKGRPLERDEPLFWEHHGNRAAREGRWKIVARGENAPWELYDLAVDRCETKDLASRRRDIVARLDAAWWDWAERSSVLPMNPSTKDSPGR